MTDTHDHTQSTITLPHLRFTVPLIQATDGVPFIPLFWLCRQIGLDPARELNHARQVLLWRHARLLPLQLDGRRIAAWYHAYPLHITYWFSMVDDRVGDPEAQKLLRQEITVGMALGARVLRQVEADFNEARKRMYALIAAFIGLQATFAAAVQRSEHISPTHRTLLLALDQRKAMLIDQASAFIRSWLAQSASLPIADVFKTNAAGAVDLSQPDGAMTLFGSISQADLATLARYEDDTRQVLTTLASILNRGDA